MKDMLELVEMAQSHNLNLKYGSDIPLEHSKEALESLFDASREGRIYTYSK
jgi:D-arabinose 1-dehydrogenase-like Zn-dependent alcohol dehydrogenase